MIDNLVSAIMPTRGRVAFAQQALKCFVAQTYPHKEIVIFDDSENPSFPEIMPREIDGTTVQYTRWPAGTVPAKRNLCCSRACGEFIAHIDSDDWSAPHRIADQVALLRQTGKAVAGYSSMFFHAAGPPEAAYVYQAAFRDYVVGTSLLYRREVWERHKFNLAMLTNEDHDFVEWARRAGMVAAAVDLAAMVARIHADNTAAKPVHLSPYSPVDMAQLPRGFRDLCELGERNTL